MLPPSPQDVISLLAAMVSFDTVTSTVSGRAEAEKPLAEWLAGVAEGWGFQTQWFPVEGSAPNLLVKHEVEAGAPWWLFDSHLDTVGVTGMTVEPFGGNLRDGKLFGRGACDTKGTGAAMLWAAREAIAMGDLTANLAILFTVGEEHAQVGARWFVENDLPNLNWRPGGVVVGEPTCLQTVVASNGFVRWQMVTQGLAAHSSTPERGHNAIYDMALAVQALKTGHIDTLQGVHPLTGRSTCSVNEIRGGVQHNIVPESCVAQVDQRLVPGETPTEALESARRALEPLSQKDSFSCEFEAIESAPPFAPEGDDSFGLFVAGKLTAVGLLSKTTGAPYTTNANHYAPVGLPCVVLGPGDIKQAHTADEWIAIEQLEAGVRAYRALMATAPVE